MPPTPSGSSSLIYIVIFLIVAYRVGSRAYLAYTRQYKTWPILAVLGALYLVLFVVRIAMHLNSPVFVVASIGVYYLSLIIFRSSSKGYTNQVSAGAAVPASAAGVWQPLPAALDNGSPALPGSPAAPPPAVRTTAQDAAPPWSQPKSPGDRAD